MPQLRRPPMPVTHHHSIPTTPPSLLFLQFLQKFTCFSSITTIIYSILLHFLHHQSNTIASHPYILFFSSTYSNNHQFHPIITSSSPIFITTTINYTFTNFSSTQGPSTTSRGPAADLPELPPPVARLGLAWPLPHLPAPIVLSLSLSLSYWG